MPSPNPVIVNHEVASSRFASNSSSSSPRKTESADIFTSGSPNVTKLRQRPFSSKSSDSQDLTSPLMDRLRKSFAICMYPDGESAIDPKNTVPSHHASVSGDEELVVKSKPEVRVLTPSSLKPLADDIIRRSNEVKRDFIEPHDLNLAIIGKPLTPSPPNTEEELKVLDSVLEKEKEVTLVQANMADALGGRAWELVAEERAFSDDDTMPGSLTDKRLPRVTPCRLLRLDIDAERKKLGHKKSIEKLRKADEKRQKLLERKRNGIKGKREQREELIQRAGRKQRVGEESDVEMVDKEMKHLEAVLKREHLLSERKAKLIEAIERQDRMSSEKLVDEFIAGEEEDEEKRKKEAEEKEEEAKQRASMEQESKQEEENDDEPCNFDLDPEIEALMAEYQISPTSSQKAVLSNQQDPGQELMSSSGQDEKTRAEKIKSFMKKTFSRQGNKVIPL